MKKKLLALILATATILACFAGCGSNEAASSSAPATPAASAAPASQADSAPNAAAPAETKVLKVNLTVGTTDPQYAWWESFVSRVEEASEGTLKLELYTDQSLGTNDEITQAVANGAEFINVPDYAGLVDYCADASIYHVPYLIQKPSQIYDLWKSDIGTELDSKLEENGVHVISAMYFGTRNVISKKPVAQAEDFKSIKLRVGTSKMWNFTAQCLGANATNTPWSEVYQALTQGVADACESPSTLLYSAKIYEVCKNLIKTEHLVCNSAVIMSADVYNSLPDVAKKALDTVGDDFAKETVELTSAVADEYDQKLIDAGVTITEIDKTPFIEYSKANVEAAFPEWTEGLYQRAYDLLYGNP